MTLLTEHTPLRIILGGFWGDLWVGDSDVRWVFEEELEDEQERRALENGGRFRVLSWFRRSTRTEKGSKE